MPKAFYAQRHHIISSLDTLLYQLHTLSYFLSPSILLYICRIIAQFLSCKPRELDAQRSLSFFYAMAVLLNLPSIWTHLTKGPAEGRAVVLDFVGMSYSPSKLQLCGLDLFILCFQFLLTTIAYETSIYYSTEVADQLSPNTSFSIPLFPNSDNGLPNNFLTPPQTKQTAWSTCPLVMDLRFRSVLSHLRNPQPPRTARNDAVLPLPNTTPFILPGMRMLLRAGRQVRSGQPSGVPRRNREIRIPGALEGTPDR